MLRLRTVVKVPGRFEISSGTWINTPSTDRQLQKLQVFTRDATARALQVAKELTGVTDVEVATLLYSHADYYYIPSKRLGRARTARQAWNPRCHRRAPALKRRSAQHGFGDGYPLRFRRIPCPNTQRPAWMEPS